MSVNNCITCTFNIDLFKAKRLCLKKRFNVQRNCIGFKVHREAGLDRLYIYINIGERKIFKGGSTVILHRAPKPMVL